jgi:hypothetical protein
MVLIGSKNVSADGKDRLYILWKWWLNMPLCMVSLRYLVACGCHIHFLDSALPRDLKNVEHMNALASDTAFPENAQDMPECCCPSNARE